MESRTIAVALLCLLQYMPVVATATEMDDNFNQYAHEELQKFGFWLGLWEFETDSFF